MVTPDDAVSNLREQVQVTTVKEIREGTSCDLLNRDAGLDRELADGAIVVKASERREVLCRTWFVQ